MQKTICSVLFSVGFLLPALAMAQAAPSPMPAPDPPPTAPARSGDAQPGAQPDATSAPAAPEQPLRATPAPREVAPRDTAPPPYYPPVGPNGRYQPAPRILKPVEAAPVGGFPLRKKRMSFSLELGYPFLDFRFGYGLSDRFQFLIGYRGLYSLSSAGYAGVKIGLFQNKERSVGVSLVALGGYNYVKDADGDGGTTKMLVGGDGGFGEGWLMATVRRRRHGLTLTGGMRISEMSGCDDSEYYCYSSVFDSGRDGTLVTAFFELGWEMRIMQFASYYVAMGVDMFTNSKDLPAMVRFRTGVMLDF